MRHFPILLLAPLFLCADPAAPSSISSTHAAYNGNKLFLEGNVALDHEFGQMEAQEACLEKDDKLHDIFSLIHLQKEVLLHFKNHGKMSCDIADLNFQTLKGLFFPKSGEKVVYTELLQKVKGTKEALLELKSDLAEVTLSKQGDAFQIEEISALKEVEIDYGKEYILNAARALFKQTDSPKLFAFSADGQSCTLSHLGDQLEAHTISFDLKKLQLILEKTHGFLESVLFPQIQKAPIVFQAEMLIWDQPQGLLKLQGGAQVEEKSCGLLQTEEEIVLKQAMQNKTKVITTIAASGKTTLKYRDPETDTLHTLHCQGPIVIEREKLCAALESPRSDDGTVAQENQIRYEQEAMAIHADLASVHYLADEKGTRLSSLSLEGGVRLLMEEEGKSSKCALADRVELSPSAHTAHLFAKPGQKVLFWDQAQQLAISAREVKVERDPISGKESVKGIGNVKFAFDDVEESLLQKIFPFYEPQKSTGT